MGILNSIALGKSRKSAGNVTFYGRLGVSCFRQKPVRSPGYKSSVAQQMQQSVFRFMKQNVDASGVKTFVDLFYDVRPRKGKSETKFNMFYRSFMPHLVAQKMAIYELAADDYVNSSIFMGTYATNTNKLTNGVLGTMFFKSVSSTAIIIDAAQLDAVIAKANTLLSGSDTPFTINNCFLGVFGAKTGSNVEYVNGTPTQIIPTLADGEYTFDVTTLLTDVDTAKQAYVVLMMASANDDGTIDLNKRKFATDSVAIGTYPKVSGMTYTYVSTNASTLSVSLASMAELNISPEQLKTALLDGSELSNPSLQATNAVVNGTKIDITVAAPSGRSFSEDMSLNPDEYYVLKVGLTPRCILVGALQGWSV